MNGPVLILALLALGAGWLALRPLTRSVLPRMTPARRGLTVAGALVVVAALLFALRLVPLGVIALVLAGGSAAKGYASRGVTEERPRRQPAAERMSRAEALAVLGLSEGATPDEVTRAHREMIVRAHPDGGGSDYLAAKVNEAREVLRG